MASIGGKNYPDPAKLRQLAKEWREQAERLLTLRSKVLSQFEMDVPVTPPRTAQVEGLERLRNDVSTSWWWGAGQQAAARAIVNTAKRILETSRACVEWAYALEEMAAKVEEQIKKAKIAHLVAIILGVLTIVLLPLEFAIGAAVALLVARLVINVTSVLTLVVNIIVDLAINFIVFGAVTFGFSMMAEYIAHRAVGENNFKISMWEILNVGLAGLLGGLFGIRHFKIPPPASRSGGVKEPPVDIPALGSDKTVRPEAGGVTGGSSSGSGATPPPGVPSRNRLELTTPPAGRTFDAPPTGAGTSGLAVTSSPVTGRGSIVAGDHAGAGSPGLRTPHLSEATSGVVGTPPPVALNSPAARGADTGTAGPRPLNLERAVRIAPDGVSPPSTPRTPLVDHVPPGSGRTVTPMSPQSEPLPSITGRSTPDGLRAVPDLSVGASPTPRPVVGHADVGRTSPDAVQVPHTGVPAVAAPSKAPPTVFQPPPKTPGPGTPVGDLAHIPSAAEAATQLRQGRASFWDGYLSDLRETFVGTVHVTPKAFAESAHTQLHSFARHFAAEAGISKELPAIQRMIDDRFATLTKGEMGPALRTVGAEIAQRAGLTPDQVVKITSNLAGRQPTDLVRGMDQLRSGLRDVRAGDEIGQLRTPQAEHARTVRQGELIHDVSSKRLVAEEAGRAAAGHPGKAMDEQAAAAKKQLQVAEDDAVAWAQQRQRDYRDLTREIGETVWQDLRVAGPEVARATEARAGLPGAAREAHWHGEVKPDLAARQQAVLATADDAYKLLPAANAEFTSVRTTSAAIAGLSRGAAGEPPRLRGLESLPDGPADELKTAFRQVLKSEFDRVWQPVVDAGLGVKSAKFKATAAHWERTYEGLKRWLYVEGLVKHEMRGLESQLHTVGAPRGVDDVTAAMTRLEPIVRKDLTELLRRSNMYDDALAGRSKGINELIRLREHARDRWIEEGNRLADAGPPAVPHELAGSVPVVSSAPEMTPTAARELGAALEAYGRHERPLLPAAVADRLATQSMREHLAAWDDVHYSRTALGPAASQISAEAGPLASSAGQVAALKRVARAHGLGRIDLPGAVVVNGGGDIPALGRTVAQARSFTETPGWTRLHLGPGVGADFLQDLASTGAGQRLIVHAPGLGDAELVALGRQIGFTPAFHGRPSIDLGAVPVDAAGVKVLPHAAVGWQVGAFGLERKLTDLLPIGAPDGRPGVLRLAEGWRLEVHTWGVWVRPPDVEAELALRIRLGDGNSVVVGAPGVEVPATVRAQVAELVTVLPKPVGRAPTVKWFDADAAGHQPHPAGHQPHPGGPSAAGFAGDASLEQLGGAMDFLRTRDLIRAQARDQLATVVDDTDLLFSGRGAAVRAEHEADVEKLIANHLGVHEWHELPDIAGFAARSTELRAQLEFRWQAHVQADDWYRYAHRRIEQAFADGSAGRMHGPFGAGTRHDRDELRAAFRGRMDDILHREVHELALEWQAAGRSVEDVGDELQKRLGPLIETIPQRAAYHVAGARSTHYFHAVDGLHPQADVRSALRSPIEQAHEEMFRPGGELSMEKWHPGARDPDAEFGRQVTSLLADGQVKTVIARAEAAANQRLWQAERARASLRAADPELDLGSASAADRIAVAEATVARVEQAIADRAARRAADGLPYDMPPGRADGFRNAMVARVDREFRSGDFLGTISGEPDAGSMAAAWRARFDELTGLRLVDDLEVAARPDEVARVARLLDDDLAEADAATSARVSELAAVRLGRAYDELLAAQLTPAEFDTAWARAVDDVRAALDGWFAGDDAARGVLERAAFDFHRVEIADLAANRTPLPREQLDDLAASFRERRLADTADPDLLPDVRRWLDRERVDGDVFASALHGQRVLDFGRQLDADLRALRGQLGPESAAEAERASTRLHREFVRQLREEMDWSRAADEALVAQWRRRYDDYVAGLESRLTLEMLHGRIAPAVDHVAAQRVDQLSLAEAVRTRLSAELSPMIDNSAFRLPPSLGVPEQRMLLTGIQKRLDAPEFDGFGRDVVQRLMEQPAPVRDGAGYAGHRQRIEASLADLSAGRTGADATRVDSMRDRLLARLDRMHSDGWNLDPKVIDRAYELELADLRAAEHAAEHAGREAAERQLRVERLPELTEALSARIDDAIGTVAARPELGATAEVYRARLLDDYATLYEHGVDREWLDRLVVTRRLDDAERDIVEEARRSAAYTDAARAVDDRLSQLDPALAVPGATRDAFREWVLTPLAATYPAWSRFDAEQATAFRQRLEDMLARTDSWIVVHRMSAELKAATGNHVRIDRTLEPYLTGSGWSLPPSMGLVEQLSLAVEIDGGQRFGPHRRHIAEHPIPVSASAGIEGASVEWNQRIDAAVARLAQRGPEYAAVAEHLGDSVRHEFDRMFAQRWNFDRAAWQERLDHRLSDAGIDEWLPSHAAHAADRIALAATIEASAARFGPEVVAEVGRSILREFDERHPDDGSYAGRPAGGRIDELIESVPTWAANRARIRQMQADVAATVAVFVAAWSKQGVAQWELTQLREFGERLHTVLGGSLPPVAADHATPRPYEEMINAFRVLSGRVDLGPGMLALVPQLKARLVPQWHGEPAPAELPGRPPEPADLRKRPDLGKEHRRFLAGLAEHQLPADVQQAVRAEAAALVGKLSKRRDPADVELLRRHLDALAERLPARVAHARRWRQEIARVQEMISPSTLGERGLDPRQAAVASDVLARRLREKLDTEVRQHAETSAALRYPADLDEALGPRLDSVLHDRFDPEAEGTAMVRDPALRELLGSPAGLDYLTGNAPQTREAALLPLAAELRMTVLEELPELAPLLPGSDAKERAFIAVLTNVRRYLAGETDTLAPAMRAAATIRDDSRDALMEHVIGHARTRSEDTALIRLAERIMDC